MSENAPIEEKKTPRKKRGLFAFLDSGVKVDAFQDGLPLRVMPYILYMAIIGIIYIGNTHYSEGLDKNYKKLNQDLEDLKATYNTLKAEYMYESKQSEVSKSLKNSGLKESTQPPIKIALDK